jgi:UDP-N-acetylglucosamine 3-dehydrogenase
MTRLKVQKAEPLRLEYQDVIAALLNDTIPTVTGEDGVAVLQVVLQLTEPTRSEDVNTREAEASLEEGVEVEA